jgi:hypothetical protein
MSAISFSENCSKEEILRERILQIVKGARNARFEALSPDNEKSLGYPYIAGYMTSALDQIEELILNP